jgi:chromosome segregation ATPase
MEKSETVKPYTTFQVCGASSIGVSAFWYRAEDYDALSAQVRELREENERIKAKYETWQTRCLRAESSLTEAQKSLATAREDALEDAANSLENMPNLEMDKNGNWHHNYPRDCADALRARAKAIRALKPTTEAGGGEHG